MPLYAATIFLSAFLLFQIQPMIAKMVLPWFGGSAAVWITCMLFFQMGLLGGYIYAHWLVRRLRPVAQALLHGLLLAASLALMPVAPAAGWKPSGTEDPIVRILGLLAVSVGLPYFLLSATSPLVQSWYARKHESALPYRLFGLSNLASLFGLLAYPFLVEPLVTVRHQSIGWSSSYAVFVVLCLTAAIRNSRVNASVPAAGAAHAPDQEGVRRPTLQEQLTWVLLASTSSVLLLSVTNHLTQNVTSVPFLWILPLGLYLLSFILCFDYEGLYRRNWYVWLLVAALAGMSYGLVRWDSHTSLKLIVPAYCGGLFVCCMFCHGELVIRKPAPKYLTSFYLMLSIGGAIGGLLVGLVAPTVFPGYFELPAALAACALLLLLINFRRWWLTDLVGFALAVGVVMASGYYIDSFTRSSLVMERNFYGGLRVTEYAKGTGDETRSLVHGTVTHGVQFTSSGRRSEALSYYGPTSGVGLAIRHLRRSPLKVGIIGLGAGSLAAYARPGDLFRFYEINPIVEEIARHEFTYLSDCKGTVEMVMGDGRLSLEREPAQRYDLLVVDAFSGDSIPVHLLTRQAIELYFRHLKPNGILALHITNSHLALVPVVGKLGRATGKETVLISNEGDDKSEVYRADWVLMTSSALKSQAILNASMPLVLRPELKVWTDDYNNLFQILK